MSNDRESFLHRWARLKRTSRGATALETDSAPDAASEPAAEESCDDIDAAALPPIESLGADSDYTAFLRRGVPAALRRAALRKAWSSDPAIADHRPLVEYDWDFNAPGFGQLRPTDDPARLVQALLGRAHRAPEPEAEQPCGSTAELAAGTETSASADPERIPSGEEERERPGIPPTSGATGSIMDTPDPVTSPYARG